MEQGHHHQFWMWTKRKYSMSSSNNTLSASPTKPSSNSYDDSSWEEQAFAEDASGPLGGCIWPPRSYTCSFCRREFRSAQALGGHMNVHRRDRARLKQPSSPQNHELQIQNQNPPSFTGFLYPYGNSLTASANPNSVLVASSPSNKALTPIPSSTFNSSSVVLPPQGHKVASNNYSSLYSSSSKFDWSKAHEAHGNITKVLDCGCEHNGKADVAFSLNLVVCRGHHHSSVEFEPKEEEQEQEEEEGEEEEEEEAEAIIDCKKRRIDNKEDHSSILPFFPNSNSSVEFSPSSMEELDLELRLGQSKHKVQ